MIKEEKKYISICYPASDIPNIIKPLEFLAWAKTDLKGSEKRARGNALSNIKKAIHSRIDEIINSTHIVYAKDWDPRIGTVDKLEILKKLDIGYTSIVKIITEIRNAYEHKYILPTKEITRAYYEATELWLNNSYDKIITARLGIVNLPILSINSDNNRNIHEIAVTDYVNIIYFWDRKKYIIKTRKNRENDIRKMNDLSWKAILEIEKKHIKKINKTKDFYYLTQKNLTKLFNFYNTMYRGPALLAMRAIIKFD